MLVCFPTNNNIYSAKINSLFNILLWSVKQKGRQQRKQGIKEIRIKKYWTKRKQEIKW